MGKQKKLIPLEAETNNLGLPEFYVVNRQQLNPTSDILYTVIPKEVPTVCPVCNGKLSIHKKIQRKIRDLDERGFRVGILIETNAYICSSCGTTHRASYPSIRKQMTNRLADAIMRDSFTNLTFSDVGKRYHVSTSTVKLLFEERGTEYWAQYHFKAPKVLGIDEVHLNNAYYGVFTRVDKANGRIIELSEERTKKAVIKVLQQMKHPERLRYVTMDMWRPYRDAVRAVFPSIPIIIDRFHVIKELSRCLDKVRSETCKSLANTKERRSLKGNRYLLLSNYDELSPSNKRNLEELFTAYPQFKVPHLLKESFRNIYAFAQSKEEALSMFNEWCKDCGEYHVTAYDDFIDMVLNWQDEIFSYFDFDGPDRTNAQTESLNRCIRNVARDGRGYSFENLRTKMIFRIEEPTSTRFDFGAFMVEEEE